MGSTVGVFTDEEVKGLSNEDKALLKKAAIQHLLTSEEIRNIISGEGTFPAILKEYPAVQKALYNQLNPLRKRLKG